MTEPLLHYFLNSAWQIPLLTLCTALALRIARPAPRTQYILWIATLLFALVLPLRGIARAPAATVDISADLEYIGPLPPVAPSTFSIPFIQVAVTPRTCNLLAALYLALTGLCAVRLLLGHLAVRRLVSASTPLLPAIHPVPGLNPVHSICILPPSHAVPLVAGILRPTILLPETLLHAAPDQLAAVFAHESAHIRRRDLLTNLTLRTLSLPIAYHPVTFYLHHRIRLTRELLVDALAASTFRSPAIYANSLLSLAGQLIRPGSRLHAHTAGLFEPASRLILEERIMHLIAPPPPSRPVIRATRIAAGVLVLSTAAAAAAFVHLTPTVLAAQQSAPAAPIAPSPNPDPAAIPFTAAPAEAPFAAPAPVVSVQPLQSPLPPIDPVHTHAPLTPLERKQLEERIHAATQQINKAANALQAQINSPAFQQQLQKQIAEATRNPIDPATEARLKQLSEEISRAQVNSPEFRKAMEALHRQIDSPEFKQHIRELSEQARRNVMSAESQRKLAEDIQRRVNSPEFRQQMAQLSADSLKLSQDALWAAQLQVPLAPLDVPPAPPARLAPQATPPDAPARISGGVMAGQRESGKNPTYPADAKSAKIQGTVILHAIISRDGTIESLQTVSGPPELQQAAWDAVKTWVYKPYLINGEPTAVETTIQVTFSLTP